MNHAELQSLILGQVEPEGITIWCTKEDKTPNPAFSKDSVHPYLYDAISSLPVLYQELTRQQLTCAACATLLDELELQGQTGKPMVIDVNMLRMTFQSMAEGMQKAQQVAQHGISKFNDMYQQEQAAKGKK